LIFQRYQANQELADARVVHNGSRNVSPPETSEDWHLLASQARPRRPAKLVGKREEKHSLGTRDPAEAKRKHLAALTVVEERWANLKVGPRRLTEREAHELAQAQHDEWLALYRDEPSDNPWVMAWGIHPISSHPSKARLSGQLLVVTVSASKGALQSRPYSDPSPLALRGGIGLFNDNVGAQLFQTMPASTNRLANSARHRFWGQTDAVKPYFVSWRWRKLPRQP